MPESTTPWISEQDVRRLIDVFSTEIQAQLAARSEQEENWERWLGVYRGKPKVENKQHPWPGASNIVVNLTAIYTEQIVARVMQGIFSAEPHWVVSEVNKRSADAVKPLERYLDLARQRFWNQYKVVKAMVLECCKLGTGILYTGWLDEPVMGFDAGQGRAIEQGRLIGPQPTWVPREDWLIPVGYSDPQRSPWVAYRNWFSKQELRRLSWQQQVDSLDALKGPGDQETRLRQMRREDQQSDASSRDDEFGLWSPWQVWFSWDLDGDGYPEEYVMLLHLDTKTCLRLLPNPYPRGMRPFVHAPFIEVEGLFDGIGIPEMVEHYQEEVSTMHNQRVDNHHLSNTPMIVARKGSGITDKAKFFTGRIWLVTDPNTDMKEFQVGHVNPFSVSEEQVTISLAERRVGVSDPNLGQVTSPMGRAAATTMMAVMQEGTRRHDLATSEIRRALTEHGYQIMELYQTHGLPSPDESGSPEAILDPPDAEQVRALFAAQDPIRGLVALQLNVATAALNREVEKQSSRQLLADVTQYFIQVVQMWPQIGPVIMNPQTPPPLKQAIVSMVKGIDAAMRGVLQSHQRYDLEPILIGDMLEDLAQLRPVTPALQMPMEGMGNGSQAAMGVPAPMAQGANGGGAGPMPMQ